MSDFIARLEILKRMDVWGRSIIPLGLILLSMLMSIFALALFRNFFGDVPWINHVITSEGAYGPRTPRSEVIDSLMTIWIGLLRNYLMKGKREIM